MSLFQFALLFIECNLFIVIMLQQVFFLDRGCFFFLSAEWSKSSDFTQLKSKEISLSKKTVKIKESDEHTVTSPRM